VIIVIIVAVAATHGGSKNHPASSASAGKIGSKVRDGKFQFVINRVTHAKNVGDTAQGLGDTAQGEYTVLHVTVTNIGTQAQNLDGTSEFISQSSSACSRRRGMSMSSHRTSCWPKLTGRKSTVPRSRDGRHQLVAAEGSRGFR